MSKIQRLVEAATSDTTPLPELLRMAWTLAMGLKTEESNMWISYELKGYPDGFDVSDLPEYRRVYAELVGDNSPFGWAPAVLTFDDPNFNHSLRSVNVSTSAIALSESSNKDQDLVFPVPDEVNRVLRREGMYVAGEPIRLARMIRSLQIKHLLEQLRSRVLSWALDVERNTHMKTEPYPELQAPVTNNYHIQNAQGVFGTNHGTISQTNTLNVQRFDALATCLREQNVSEHDIENLRVAIQADPPSPQASTELGPRVQGWIGRMLMLSASGTWSIAANTAGSLLASLIAKYYGLG